MFLRARRTSPSDGSPNTVVAAMCSMCLNRLNRLHYGFGKFIYFCFQQKKIACIIEIIEKKLCHFFLSCTLCLFFLCHFFLVPFFPVPFFPVPFFPVPFFPTLTMTWGVCDSITLYLNGTFSWKMYHLQPSTQHKDFLKSKICAGFFMRPPKKVELGDNFYKIPTEKTMIMDIKMEKPYIVSVTIED